MRRPACKNVLLLADTREVDAKMVPSIQADAQKIGITFHGALVEGAYPAIQTPSQNIPLAERPGWGKDYADASPSSTRSSTAGRSRRTATRTTRSSGSRRRWRRRCTSRVTSDVPSVDADLDHCAALAGSQRLACYGDLDRKLMTEVVPWVPYLWSFATHITGPTVTQVGLRPVHGVDRLRARRGRVGAANPAANSSPHGLQRFPLC